MNAAVGFGVTVALIVFGSLIAYLIYKPVDSRYIGIISNGAPPVAIVLLFVSWWIFHTTPSIWPSMVLALHHAGLVALFLFLFCVSVLQLVVILYLPRRPSYSTVAAIYLRIYILAESIPGFAAILIFLSGLHLIWLAPSRNSPDQLWLTILVSVFSFMFWDGIIFYRPLVANAAKRSAVMVTKRGSSLERPVSAMTRLGHAQLMVHSVSFLILLPIALFHPKGTTQIGLITDWIRLKIDNLPLGAAECLTVVFVWIFTGILLFCVKFSRRNWDLQSIS